MALRQPLSRLHAGARRIIGRDEAIPAKVEIQIKLAGVAKFLEARLAVKQDCLGLALAAVKDFWPMDREPLVATIIPIFAPGDILQVRRRIAPSAIHLGRVGQHLNVAVEVLGEDVEFR